MIHLFVGIILRPYSDMYLKRDLLNKAFKIDATEKDKLVSSQASMLNRQNSRGPNSTTGGDSSRSTGRDANKFGSGSARVLP